MTRAESEARLDLLMIQAKYDGSGMPSVLFLVLKQIETDIAWMQNADRPVPEYRAVVDAMLSARPRTWDCLR
jgi:hypothetical protein